jgi:hypothetical protein
MMYTKEHIDSLDKALQEHNKLKNSFKENKLLSLGLQQEARELQKPITDAIDRLDRVVVQKTVVNSTPQESIEDVEDINITPLNPTSSNASYSLIKTPTTISNPNKNIELPIWKFNSSSKSNVGKWVLFLKSDEEFIWDYKYESQPIILSKGLKEILFNDSRDTSIINQDDITNWIELINKSGLGSKYKNTIVYKRLSHGTSATQGDGIDTIIIPSDPEELCKQLELQLKAHIAGHKNTFSTVNALLKQLLTQKQIKSRDYRNILRKYYHV